MNVEQQNVEVRSRGELASFSILNSKFCGSLGMSNDEVGVNLLPCSLFLAQYSIFNCGGQGTRTLTAFQRIRLADERSKPVSAYPPLES